MDDLFPGFDSHWIDGEAGRLFARSAGSGEPLVLLHGFPQTHAMWHRIAPELARTHAVVCMDLRGYGWSSAPRGDGGRSTYAKRTLARDVIAVMEKLGHVRFGVVGHDRGARVGYRLALDQPGRVTRLALLDILPTFAMWRQIEAGTVSAEHWEFLSRPEPEPERAIGQDPLPYFEGLLKKWSRSGDLSAFDPRALELYRQSCNEPNRIHAFCEDYRAGAGVDREADEADLAAGRTVECPAFVIWGDYLTRGATTVSDTPLDVWRMSFAPDASGRAVDAGHFLAEEDPAGTLAALRGFLA